MALTLVTDVTDEPVSLEETKEHLRLDITADDAYVADCITAARVWVEGQTKRALMPKTYDYKIDYNWINSITFISKTGERAIAVGDQGLILWTDNGGDEWDIVRYPEKSVELVLSP